MADTEMISHVPDDRMDVIGIRGDNGDRQREQIFLAPR